ncbi:inactive ubiquitin carboxyl-terminal hydrolase 53-like [Olea europaea subsp. europaea]|uniref:Inactive ubiquitin carboxyl-terminal hydrolase 53-like, partial n=1 Tax=Olea europaea subsp. europaea TaxID=158383 RepID=A0A8S0SBG5_OLEEU|nr:inactive ubiquitin carboxyl-terminal hydrolase 53-like [Olea europaea subsp. europaea]
MELSSEKRKKIENNFSIPRHSDAKQVCYYGQHYHCFAYSRDLEQWIVYDDKTVKVIGGWNDVLTMCIKGHLQPQVLFFEAVN